MLLLVTDSFVPTGSTGHATAAGLVLLLLTLLTLMHKALAPCPAPQCSSLQHNHCAQRNLPCCLHRTCTTCRAHLSSSAGRWTHGPVLVCHFSESGPIPGEQALAVLRDAAPQGPCPQGLGNWWLPSSGLSTQGTCCRDPRDPTCPSSPQHAHSCTLQLPRPSHTVH